jgi:hypothetical protein
MNNQNIRNSAFPQETWSSERVNELTMSRINSTAQNTGAHQRGALHYGRRFATIAIAAVLMLSFSGIALAATGVIDFGPFHNSIFNNTEADQFVKSGEGVSAKGEGEIKIEVLAGFIDENRGGVYVQLKLQDPTGTKLSDSLTFVKNGSEYVPADNVSVEMTDANTAIASIFVQEPDAIDGAVRIGFDTIASGIHIVGPQSTDFNIGAQIGLTEPVRVPDAKFIELTSVTCTGGILKISYRNADTSKYGWGLPDTLSVQTQDGERILFADGTKEYGNTGWTWTYEFEIGTADPNDLTLVWQGKKVDTTVTGDWAFTVSADNILKPHTIEGTIDGNYAQAIIGGTGLSLNIVGNVLNSEFLDRIKKVSAISTANGGADVTFDDLTVEGIGILLTDGTIVSPKFGDCYAGEDMSRLSFITEFVNPDDVVSVTFFGETFDGSLGTLTDEEADTARNYLNEYNALAARAGDEG